MDTITITIPQVKINLNLKDITFDTLENTVFHTQMCSGRKTIEKALFDIDNILREKRPKGTLENLGKKAKYFGTRLGDIRYRRTAYKDKAGGKLRCLLEERLGIRKNQRLSLTRLKIETFLASLTTYRATEENMELLTGVKRSHEAIRQSVIKEGQGLIEHRKAEFDKIRRLEDTEGEARPSHDMAYVESDATYIRRQRRHKRKGRPYRRRGRRRKSFEVKLGIGYTDKVRRYNKGRGRGLKLKDKFTYASIEDGKTFMDNLSLIAEKKLSLSRAKKVIFGGDGGSYITAGIRDFFPNAVYILSKFHLKRAVKTALARRPKAQKAINKLLKKDKIDIVLSLLWRLIQRAEDRKDRIALQDLYAYIRNNRQGINPIKRIKDKVIRGKIKGTGAMEANVDKLIAHRFKKRGMSWSEKGAQSLLKVKEAIANDEWDSWWQGRRDEPVQINTEPLRQLTAKDFWKKEPDKPPLVEMALPALHGPDRDEPWAHVIRELQTIDYYK